MMKPILVAALFLMCCGCACSVNQKPELTPSPSPSADSSAEKKAVDIVGEETQFGTPIVSLVMKDGQITSISIDEISGESTKKQMGDSYKLPDTAVDTWTNQIAFLENYILKHDVNQIQTDTSGKAMNQDLLSGCTIQIDNYLKTVKKAMNEAK